MLEANYQKVFPTGLAIGTLAGNRLLWTADAAGLASLQTTLAEPAFLSGALSQSATNSESTLGGGQLAQEAI